MSLREWWDSPASCWTMLGSLAVMATDHFGQGAWGLMAVDLAGVFLMRHYALRATEDGTHTSRSNDE